MLYIDASRYSNTNRRTGVENYSYFLINELVRQHGDNITLLTPKKIDLNVKQCVMPFKRLWTLVRLSWEIWRDKKIDNLFVPSHVLPLVHPKNSVITIHDVVFKYSPESYGLFSRIYLNWATKFAVKHAAKIITPSEATKQDLIYFFKADPQKINVIPLGFQSSDEQLSVKSAKELLEHFQLAPHSYFLYVGRLEYKKNTDTLLKAFYEFAESHPEIKLVLCGFQGHGGEAIIKSIPEKWKRRIIQTGYLSGQEKEVLMKHALCFIFPSRFEGFGLPLLEAMNAELPIIASDIPTSREIMGNHALLFEKENHEALAELMEKVCQEADLRQRMTKAYPDILKNYSWERCGEEVMKLIDQY